MKTAERSELLGKTLDGRYRVNRRLGIGGTGVVFDAVRLEDNTPLVVKTMRPLFADHPDLRRRLQREAEVARAVPHPGIAPAYDEGILHDGSPYVVMKKIEGESLGQLLLREPMLPAPEVAAIVMRVSAILHAAHAQGYVHRDVKPEHIILDRNERDVLEVTLLDFGVCAARTAPAEERERERGRVFGTPTYASPEQASGEPDVDARADVFALGVVMFEALVGRVPFSASNVASLLKRIIREDAPRAGLIRPQIGRELDAVIARALSREKSHRFMTMRALSRALAPHAGDRWEAERQLKRRLGVAGEAPPEVETLARGQVAV